MAEKIKKVKKRRTPKAWLKRYFRILLGGTLVAIMVLFSIFGPMLTGQDIDKTDITNKYAEASDEHWLGTDQYGRDYFTRIAYGGRLTILVAVVAQICVIGLGIVLGLLCGYYRPFDNVCSRILEAIHSLPSQLTIIIVAGVIGQGFGSVLIALIIGGIYGITRNLRGQVLSLRAKEFIEAEKAMGASAPRTIFMHILPQTTNYLVIRFGTGLSSSVMTTASLSYLGIGLDPQTPNWGGMISEAQGLIMVRPELVVYPGICVILLVFGFSLLGEGLRDVLDPKYR